MRRTRLLLVTDEMEVGGTQRQIVHLARGLDRDHFEPSVVYFRRSSFLVDELQSAGVPVLHVPKHRRIDPLFVYRLAAALRKGRFDLIHAFSFTGELWAAVARRLAGHTPLLSSVRNVYAWYSPTQWRVKRWVTSQSVRVVANSRAGATFAEARLGLRPETIRVVHNGTPLVGVSPPGEAKSLRAEWGLQPGGVVGLFLGRLVPLKNVASLLRAVAGLNGAADRLVLVIAGDGSERADLERLGRDLGLSRRVRFLGERQDAGRLISAADFLVQPSVQEGLSNTVLEAMAAGRPVIASAVGGNGELVTHGRTGLLYPSGDEAALVQCLRLMVDDPVSRAAFSRAARVRVEEAFAIPAMVKAMEKIYAEALAQVDLRSASTGG